MNLGESVSGRRLKMELSKGSGYRQGTIVVVDENTDMDPDRIYNGDISSFELFVNELNGFLAQAKRFDAIEVPRL